jgi:hypothetical protein
VFVFLLPERLMLRLFVWLCASVATLFILNGCGAYQVRGHVVRGPMSFVEFVSASDPRLSEPGVANANIDVIRDPQSLGRETVAALRSDGSGEFLLRIDEAGVGWMDEEWRILCYSIGFSDADRTMRLPSGGDDVRLLITLAPGRSGAAEEDPWRQYEPNR